MAETVSAKTAWALASAIKSAVSPPSGKSTQTATFVRRDTDGTCWVRLPGNDFDTPVNGQALADAEPGQTVQCAIDGTSLTMVGNASDPAVGVARMTKAVGNVLNALESAKASLTKASENAQKVADAAKSVADAVNQHFFSDTNGIHVTEATQEDWDANHTGANVLINSIGQLFRDGLNNLLTLTTENGARALTVWDGLGNAASNIRAIIGEVITLGPVGSVRMILSSDGIEIDNEAGTTVFSVESNSTGSITVTVVAEVVTWAAETDVTSTPNMVSDASAAAGDVIVTATVAGTDYTLDSTYATATVTAGTGVSVALTSPDGVAYVRSLMSNAEVTTGTLSVEYQRTVADSALLTIDGNQIISNVGRAMRLHNDQWSNNSQTETFYVAKNVSTGAAVMFGVGSGGYNRGVFDATAGTWLIYRNQSAQTVISGSNFAVYANGGIRTRGGGSSDFSGRIVAQQRIESRNSLGNVALEAANSGNKGVWDTTDSLWIICRTSDGNIVINGDNFSVASSGSVSAGTTVTARGTNNVALYSSASSGDMGLRDMTNSKWIIYRHHDYGIVLGNSAADSLYHRTSTCTVNSTNATIYNSVNHCWQNGATCTVSLSVNLKSSLANASTVDVATAPENYRPPHAVMGSVYVTGQNVNLQASILSAGTIRVNNRSGTTITSSANIYMSFTFAL